MTDVSTFKSATIIVVSPIAEVREDHVGEGDVIESMGVTSSRECAEDMTLAASYY